MIVLKIIFYYLSIFFVGTSSRGLRIKLVTSENAHDLYTHGKRQFEKTNHCTDQMQILICNQLRANNTKYYSVISVRMKAIKSKSIIADRTSTLKHVKCTTCALFINAKNGNQLDWNGSRAKITSSFRRDVQLCFAVCNSI